LVGASDLDGVTVADADDQAEEYSFNHGIWTIEEGRKRRTTVHLSYAAAFDRPAIGGIIKTNYVLIDYESVQPEIVATLKDDHFKILMFIGPNQARIDINVATALQALGTRAEYIRVSAAGRNALDFHIAYYLGRLAVSEPDAYFHVIAVDKGYDPLIEHLRSKGIQATRCADVNDIPIVRTSGTAPADDKLSIILAYLVKRGAQRPASTKTLSTSIGALFQPKLDDGEVQTLLAELQRNGVFVVNGSKVAYSLPD